jgi:hypothetical protein
MVIFAVFRDKLNEMFSAALFKDFKHLTFKFTISKSILVAT